MPRKASLNQWLTVSEAADVLGYSRANIWDLIKTGVFPSATLRGRGYLINAQDVEKRKKFIAERSARAAERASRKNKPAVNA